MANKRPAAGGLISAGLVIAGIACEIVKLPSWVGYGLFGVAVILGAGAVVLLVRRPPAVGGPTLPPEAAPLPPPPPPPRRTTKAHSKLVHAVAQSALDSVRDGKMVHFAVDDHVETVYRTVLCGHAHSVVGPLDDWDAAVRHVGEVQGAVSSRLYQKLGQREMHQGPWDPGLGAMMTTFVNFRALSQTTLPPAFEWRETGGAVFWGEPGDGARVLQHTTDIDCPSFLRRFEILLTEMITWDEVAAIYPAYVRRRRSAMAVESTLRLVLNQDRFGGACPLCPEAGAI